MSLDLRRRIFDELQQLTLIDPHTHINPHDPASHSLADILGYHYYTELAHSAGLSREKIEDPALSSRDKVGLLIANLGPIENTAQYGWFVDIARDLFGYEGDTIDAGRWEQLADAAEERMAAEDWPQQVLEHSRIESVFLTNDFDDALEGFDTNTYIPCLRTDDLVFHLTKPEVRERLERASNVDVRDAGSLQLAIERLFRHFKSRGARACAISLPPDFSPAFVSRNRADVALEALLRNGVDTLDSHRKAVSNYVFRTLAQMCDRYQMPFDLMIGVNRGVYEGGVHQGRDLYDSRVSLIQYKEIFNAFPNVTFPVSVLASSTNQELTSYAWIFPNVVTNGHWWYSNTPTFIEHDLSARLEAVPRTKQVGYYSDAYKLEFAAPKFAMYKKTLAKVLAERFVIDRGWSEQRAVDLGQQLLRGNVESIFKMGEDPRAFELPPEEAYVPTQTLPAAPVAGVMSDEYQSYSDKYGGATAAAPLLAAGVGAAGLGAAALGTAGAFDGLGENRPLGGSVFSVPEPLLRPAGEEIVIQPGEDDGGQIALEGPHDLPPQAESGFVLDEMNLESPRGEALDLGSFEPNQEAETLAGSFPIDLEPQAEELSFEAESPAESPADFLPFPAAVDYPKPLVFPTMPAEAVNDGEALQLEESPPLSLELPAFDAVADDDEPMAMEMVEELEAVEPVDAIATPAAAEVVEEDAFSFEAFEEAPAAEADALEGIQLDEPAAEPEADQGFKFDVPEPPKKDGGMFDFLK